MQSLTDLCLNKIEDSGADTRELADADLPRRMWNRHPVLRIAGSHYFCTEDANTVPGSRVLEGELRTEIEVIYTGVYTLKCHIYIADGGSEHKFAAFNFDYINRVIDVVPANVTIADLTEKEESFTEEQKQTGYNWLGMKGPVNFEKTFESLEHQLTPEQLDFVHNGPFKHQGWRGAPQRQIVRQATVEQITQAQKNVLVTELGRLLLKVGRAYFIEMYLNGTVEISLGEWENEADDLWDHLAPKIAQAMLFTGAHISI